MCYFFNVYYLFFVVSDWTIRKTIHHATKLTQAVIIITTDTTTFILTTTMLYINDNNEDGAGDDDDGKSYSSSFVRPEVLAARRDRFHGLAQFAVEVGFLQEGERWLRRRRGEVCFVGAADVADVANHCLLRRDAGVGALYVF